MTTYFVASQDNYKDHLYPLFERMPGKRTIAKSIEGWSTTPGDTIVTAAQRDFIATKDMDGTHVYMEHGVGLQTHKQSTILTLNKYQPMVLVPNWYTVNDLRKNHFTGDIYVVGTPKMEKLRKVQAGTDTLAFSFHWTGKGKNWTRFKEPIQQLADMYPVIGHGHPKDWDRLATYWESIGIEAVKDFEDVVDRAYLLVCDHSSIIYEWAALDRPVILLDNSRLAENKSRFTSLRYTDYSEVGPEATPDSLVDEVRFTLNEPWIYRPERVSATENLFPHLNDSVSIAVELIATGKTTRADISRRIK